MFTFNQVNKVCTWRIAEAIDIHTEYSKDNRTPRKSGSDFL